MDLNVSNKCILRYTKHKMLLLNSKLETIVGHFICIRNDSICWLWYMNHIRNLLIALWCIIHIDKLLIGLRWHFFNAQLQQQLTRRNQIAWYHNNASNNRTQPNYKVNEILTILFDDHFQCGHIVFEIQARNAMWTFGMIWKICKLWKLWTIQNLIESKIAEHTDRTNILFHRILIRIDLWHKCLNIRWHHFNEVLSRYWAWK